MANRAYLVNINKYSLDQDLPFPDPELNLDFLVAGDAAYRVPIPWLCCFEPSDLHLEEYRRDEDEDEDDEEMANYRVPMLCTSVETAIRKLETKRWLFEEIAGDPEIGAAYWQCAMLTLRAMPHPFLTMNPSEIESLCDEEEFKEQLRTALVGDRDSIEAMKWLSSYDDSAVPYPWDVMLAVAGMDRDDPSVASAVALDFINSEVDVDFAAMGHGLHLVAQNIMALAKAHCESTDGWLSFVPDSEPLQLKLLLLTDTDAERDRLRDDNAFSTGLAGVVEADLRPILAKYGYTWAGHVIESRPAIDRDHDGDYDFWLVDPAQRRARRKPAEQESSDTIPVADMCYTAVGADGCARCRGLIYPERRAMCHNCEALLSFNVIKLWDDDDTTGLQDGLRDFDEKNYKAAMRAWLPKVSAGNPWATYALGLMYHHGLGVARDSEAGMRWFRRAAEKGHADAQFMLGWAAHTGQGLPRDNAEALKWFRLAGAEGNTDAQYYAAALYAQGDGTAQDEDEALKWLRMAAEGGDAHAQLALGVRYAEGEGVANDDAEAVRWFRRAAKEGIGAAQNYLGFMYQHGRGIEQNDEKAFKWFSRAAERGNVDALCNLGLAYEYGQGVAADSARAFEYYRQAAEEGNAMAQCQLASLYERGEGTEEDGEEALRWYREAADGEDPQAQYWMGEACEDGEGMPADPAQALNWYLAAAEQGHARAQAALASMYVGEHGVPENYREALRWAGRAADQGDLDGKKVVGMLYYHGWGVPRDHATAYQWWLEAANEGHPLVQLWLGDYFDSNEHTPRNVRQAIHWYRLAAAQGMVAAWTCLGVLFNYGDGVERNLVVAYALTSLAAEEGDDNAITNLEVLDNTIWRRDRERALRVAEEMKIPGNFINALDTAIAGKSFLQKLFDQ